MRTHRWKVADVRTFFRAVALVPLRAAFLAACERANRHHPVSARSQSSSCPLHRLYPPLLASRARSPAVVPQTARCPFPAEVTEPS